MREDDLLTGKLEETNEGYSISKIAGLKACEKLSEQYGIETLSVMPCNLYGQNDSFDLENSHVLSALVKRFYSAKVNQLDSVTLWGDGSAKREFMNVVDAAEAVYFLMKFYKKSELINLGTGSDLTIRELAELIKNKTGFQGKIIWNRDMPNGMPQKLLDVSKLNSLGFKPKISLEDGIEEMIKIYKNSL